MFRYSLEYLVTQQIKCMIFKRFMLKNVEPLCMGTMEEVKKKYLIEMGVGIGYMPLDSKQDDHLLKYVIKQEDLPPRTIKDSYVKAILPLNVKRQLQLNYVNHNGRVRLSRLVEEMDMFAGITALNYFKLPHVPPEENFPFYLVTVLVDNLKVHKLPKYDKDVHFLGLVSWVGKSSFEITIELLYENHNSMCVITRAHFLMAARNATMTGPAYINPLIATNEEEQNIIDSAITRTKTRQEKQSRTVYTIRPTLEEHNIMYESFIKTSVTGSNQINQRVLPSDGIWMADSAVSTTILSFPQNRNANNTVFGGFLMRSNLQLATVAAIRHCRHRPQCKYISRFTFEKPIPIDSIVSVRSTIIYTQGTYVLVMTVNDSVKLKPHELVTSNTSYIIFKAPHAVRQIYPRTYQETLWFLQGRRIYNDIILLDDNQSVDIPEK